MRLIRNGLVFDGSSFVAADVVLDGDRIAEVGPAPAGPFDAVLDARGSRVVPGFIDLHFHGAVGHDVMDAVPGGLDRICDYQARSGTTSFLATTITAGMPDLLAAVERIADHASRPGGARIVGLHIEGPFISPKQKGCHQIEWMKAPTRADYDAIRGHAARAQLHFTVAPELDGAEGFIRAATGDGATVSIGHTDAGAAEVRRGLESGARIFTHLFNAMRGLHHRELGVAGTALDSAADVELICDGVHVAPEIVNLVYRLKGRDRLVLVTDAMSATGLGDGEYEFGGYKVTVRDGIARKEDGALASSTITLLDAVRNLMHFTGASLADVLPTVTSNPARVLGMGDRLGSIAPGKQADLLLLDGELRVVAVFCRGVKVA